jgi:hypothetical protein
MGKPNRLNNKTKQEDIDAYAAMLAAEDYHPNNPEFELAEVTASHDAMQTKQTEEVQKNAAADAGRDAADDAERSFHKMMLGVKAQFKSQYGENSDEYASLGLKKKNEYRSGKRNPAKTPDNPT